MSNKIKIVGEKSGYRPGSFSNSEDVGSIHYPSFGAYDDLTLCGLTGEGYEIESTTDKVTCTTCIDSLERLKKYYQKYKDE